MKDMKEWIYNFMIKNEYTDDLHRMHISVATANLANGQNTIELNSGFLLDRCYTELLQLEQEGRVKSISRLPKEASIWIAIK